MHVSMFRSCSSRFVVVGMLSALFVALTAEAAELVAPHQAADTVIVRDVREQNGLVYGQISNRSSRLIRDVRLLIRLTWSWNDERNPGAESPGRAVYHTVAEDIAPGESLVFHYRPDPPLPQRTDGRFGVSAEVVGLTEIGD